MKTKLLVLGLVLGIAMPTFLLPNETLADTSTGLVAHWKMDEALGATTVDSSGSNNKGTLAGAPAWTAGKFNSALQFNGSNEVTAADSNAFSFGNGGVDQPFSASVWVNFDSLGSGNFVGHYNVNVAGREWRFGKLGGAIYLILFDESNGSFIARGIIPSLVTGTWYHLVATYDGSKNGNNIKFYVNGTSQAQQTSSDNGPYSGMRNLTANLEIGGTNGRGELVGKLDDIRIYNRVLSATDVTEIYNGVAPPADTTSPSAPTNLSTTVISSSQINLSWIASIDPSAGSGQASGVTGYQVERCQGAGCSSFAQVGTPTSNSFLSTSLTPSTSYSFRVKAQDAAGNLSSYSSTVSATTQAPPDITAPVISGNSASNITPTGASISWTTDEPADSQVEYGTTAGYGLSTSLDATLVTTHSQALSNLSSNTLYHYRVKSKDGAGNLASSSDNVFTTLAPLPVDPNLSAVVVTSPFAVTGGPASTVNVSVKNSSGNLVSGLTVVLSAGSGSSVITPVGGGVTNASGVASFTLTDAIAEDITYFATVDPTGQNVNVTQTTTVHFFTSMPKLRVSPADHHFLETAQGQPFFWLGDTVWSLSRGVISLSDVDAYLADTQQKGFNAIQVTLDPYTDGNFVPYLNNDTDNRNEQFWSKIDYIVNQANYRHIYVGLVIAWPYSLPYWNNSLTKIDSVGRWIGSRYANSNNVVWFIAGEYSTNFAYCAGCISAAEKAKFETMAAALKAGGATQLMTIHPGHHSSLPDFNTSSWLDFTVQQSGHSSNTHNRVVEPADETETWEKIAYDYNNSTIRPTFDAEINYEDAWDKSTTRTGPTSPHITPASVRRKAYWGVFAGGDGVTYGHESLVCIAVPGYAGCEGAYNGIDPSQDTLLWQDALSATGRGQMHHLKALVESQPILGRIPDQSVITSANIIGIDHMQATRATDGSYAWVYMPTGALVGVNMAKISLPLVDASWYNPRDGSSVLIGQFSNIGIQTFDAPGATADGNDWVLVLQGMTDIQAPTSPTNLLASPVSSSQINLNWTASTDNIGVTGYQIERCQGLGCANFVLVGSPTTNFFSSTNLSASTQYTFRVRALDAAGNLSSYSSTVFATTQASPIPTSVSNFRSTINSIILSWNNPSDPLVQNIIIERSTSGFLQTYSSNAVIVILPANQTFYIDTSILPNTTYYYTIFTRSSDYVYSEPTFISFP